MGYTFARLSVYAWSGSGSVAAPIRREAALTGDDRLARRISESRDLLDRQPPWCWIWSRSMLASEPSVANPARSEWLP